MTTLSIFMESLFHKRHFNIHNMYTWWWWLTFAGKAADKQTIVIDGKTQYYHHHEHFHHYKSQPRSLRLNEDTVLQEDLVPSYHLRANSKFVEATFRLPNGGNSSHIQFHHHQKQQQHPQLVHQDKKPSESSHHHYSPPVAALPEVIEVKQNLVNKDGDFDFLIDDGENWFYFTISKYK